MKKQLPLALPFCTVLLFSLMAYSGTAVAAGCTPISYCTPSGNTNIFGNGYVTQFKITDPLNTVLLDKTAAAAASCCGYVDNTAAGTPSLTQGVTYTISGSRKCVDFLQAWNYGMNIWIDYNDDGTFDNTNGSFEVVFKQGQTNVEPFSFSYTVPMSGIRTGIHRLRIRTHYQDSNPDPCASLSNGAQGMDFIVNIVCAHTPPVAFTGNDTTVCAGNDIPLVSGATGGNAPYSFLWCGPTGYSSTQQSTLLTNVALTASGTYFVTIADSNGCVSTASMDITVSSSGTANASSNSPVCVGDTLKLSSTAGINYTWSGPNGFTSTNQNPQIVPVSITDTGIYTVVVTIGSGCTGSASLLVTVNTAPSVTASAAADSICYGASIDLFSSGGTDYAWTGPNGFTSTDQNPVVPVALGSGTYTVVVTDANGCNASDSVKVFTYAPMTPPVILQAGDSLVVADTTYSSYQWYADISPIPGATTNILQVTASGNYNIQVTDESGCDIAVGINVTLTGFPSLPGSEGHSISVYPNPAREQLSISGLPLSDEKELRFNVINVVGQEVISSATLQRKGKEGILYINHLAPGIYFLHLKTKDETLVKKFIKQ